MKSKEIQEKIEFLVQKWLDEAPLESIVEYAGDKLREFYVKLEDAKVVEMYEEEGSFSWGEPRS